MNVTIIPKKLKGEVIIPASKSLTHRALICAALSKGRSVIYNPLYCDDTIMTLNALKTFGVEVNTYSNRIEIIGVSEFIFTEAIEVGDSASTLRFLLPILAVSNDYFIIKASRRLIERVNTSDLNKLKGLEIKVFDDYLEVEGRLDVEAIEIDDSLTSQLISGILFTLPIINKRFKWNDINNPYINLTMGMMKTFGVDFNISDNYLETLNIYKNNDVIIESDYSGAAFFIIMAVLNNDINIIGLNYNSIQGDMAVFSYLEKMGVVFKYGDYLEIMQSNLKGANLDMSLTPDLVPIMAAVASVSKGRSEFSGLEKLPLKESNRLEASYEFLNTLGAEIKIDQNKLIINGKEHLKGGVELSSHNDHRIIMSSVAISSRINNPYTIKEAQHVNKSLPTFFNLYEQLGGLYESKLSK